MSHEPNEISESIYVARQPIFDVNLGVWGYELLFRASADAAMAHVDDNDMATAKVIADGFVMASTGMEPGQRALINFPQNLIIQQFAFALPSDIAVVEILEDVEPTPAVLSAIKEYKTSGYTVALDDFMGEESLKAFLPFADILKVDILGVLGPEGAKNANKLQPIMQGISQFDGTLLAEKVEDEAVFTLCKKLGFTLFQGYFFSKPQIIPGKKISSTEISKLQLLQELGSPHFKVQKISDIIQRDPSLSYRLLRYINSVGLGVTHKVESVSRAITLLGQRQLSQWLRVVIMSDIAPSQKGKEIAFLAVHRGKFLELLAEYCPSQSPESLFLLGLFSLLDALLDQPMEEILPHLPLEQELIQALLGQHNHFTGYLAMTKAMEQSNRDVILQLAEQLNLPQHLAAPLYTQAMQWTIEIIGHSLTPQDA